MKNLRKHWALPIALLALVATFATAPTRAMAQEEDAAAMKTMAVVSISGYQQLLDDLEYIGKQVDREGLPQILEGLLAGATQGRGMQGLDKDRPWGLVVQTDGQQFEPLAFLPVTDLKQIITTIGIVSGTEAEEGEDGVYELEAGQQTIYVKESNGWAFVTKSKEALTSVPKEPLTLLDGLNEKYDFAVRLYVQNIPQVFRGMAVQQLRQGVELGLDRLPDETDEAYEQRKRIVQYQLKQIDMLFEQTNAVTVGWSVEPDEQRTYLDLAMTAVPGTDLAKQTAQYGGAMTDYAGFMLVDAALRSNWAMKMEDKAQIAQSVEVIDGFTARARQAIAEDAGLESDEAREALQSALDSAMDVLKQTIESGRFDGGMLVQLDPGAMTAVIGGYVADGAKLEESLKQLAEVMEEDPDFKGVEWDFAEHDGVRFHRMQVPIEEEEAQKALGEQLDVVVGVGKTSFYAALGKNSLETLKAIIDASKENAGKEISPFEMVISVGDIVRFAAATNDDPQTARVAEALDENEEKDNVVITLSALENGFLYHIELEQGVLRAIGAASSAAALGPEADDDF